MRTLPSLSPDRAAPPPTALIRANAPAPIDPKPSPAASMQAKTPSMSSAARGPRRAATLALATVTLVLPPWIAEAEPASPVPVEVFAEIEGAMPTGVAATPDGRLFLTWPQWGDGAPFTLGELVEGHPRPWPSAEANAWDPAAPSAALLSVQSAVPDAAGRLWALDTGAPGFQAPIPGAAKLVAYDLASGEAVRTIPFGPEELLPTSYVNDLRIDLGAGAAGTIYVTDSSLSGPGGIIVVDIASGTAIRRLSGHASTSPEPDFSMSFDGEPLRVRPAGAPAQPWRVASDGIALSADGATLYWCALTSRRLYSAPTALLRDPEVTEAELAAAVRDLGLKPPSDGLAEDDRGRIYAGDLEGNAIHVLDPHGGWRLLARDPRMRWPDTLSVGADGWLYVTANQLDRQAGFHEGRDLRQPPYRVLRIKIGAGPVLRD